VAVGVAEVAAAGLIDGESRTEHRQFRRHSSARRRTARPPPSSRAVGSGDLV